MVPSVTGKPSGNEMLIDKLPEEINEMKIRDDKVEKVIFYELKEILSFCFLFLASRLHSIFYG